jgi:hypothetical protein
MLSRLSDEYNIKTTFLGQTQEIELCIRDNNLTKRILGGFTKECQIHSFPFAVAYVADPSVCTLTQIKKGSFFLACCFLTMLACSALIVIFGTEVWIALLKNSMLEKNYPS